MRRVEIQRGSREWLEFEERYDNCCRACRQGDADGFLEWAGPDGTWTRADGTIGRWADTRDFWEWRFSVVLGVEQFDITIERVAVDEDGRYEVDFHEISRVSVRGFNGRPASRVADLRNRNWWRRTATGLNLVDIAELQGTRTLNDAALKDVDDPMGFATWAQMHSDQGSGTASTE